MTGNEQFERPPLGVNAADSISSDTVIHDSSAVSQVSCLCQ